VIVVAFRSGKRLAPETHQWSFKQKQN